MKAATAALPVAHSRVTDYLELVRPRMTLMVLFTVAAGGILAGFKDGDGLLLLHAILATGMVAAGASALNQFLERHTDALMRRTENRPLPSGRLQPAEVLAFGLLLSFGGLVYMATVVRQPVAVLLTAITLLSYVSLYTPLKRITTLNTLIGAVPGALPPVIGWAALRGSIGLEAVLVFLILFMWQLPHFLAIAWIYRADYARAGMRMLPVTDPTGRDTGRKMAGFCLALVAASLAPSILGKANLWYFAGALLLGGLFVASTVAFWRDTTVPQARRVLRASLIYLPLLLLLLLLEGLANTVAFAFAW